MNLYAYKRLLVLLTIKQKKIQKYSATLIFWTQSENQLFPFKNYNFYRKKVGPTGPRQQT